MTSTREKDVREGFCRAFLSYGVKKKGNVRSRPVVGPLPYAVAAL